MGSRDHSETCDICGFERGGMNDLPCDCDGGYRQFSWLIAEKLESLGHQLTIAAALCEAFKRGEWSQSCGNCDSTYFDFKWRPGCGVSNEYDYEDAP